MQAYRRTAGAVVLTILEDRYGPDGIAAASDVTDFVVAQHARAPDWLRWAMLAVTLFFTCAALVTAGAFFTSLSARRRQRALGLWRTSPVGPMRDFVLFYESLSVFAYWARSMGTLPADPSRTPSHHPPAASPRAPRIGRVA